jgi:hypothetical protein
MLGWGTKEAVLSTPASGPIQAAASIAPQKKRSKWIRSGGIRWLTCSRVSTASTMPAAGQVDLALGQGGAQRLLDQGVDGADRAGPAGAVAAAASETAAW